MEQINFLFFSIFIDPIFRQFSYGIFRKHLYKYPSKGATWGVVFLFLYMRCYLNSV